MAYSAYDYDTLKPAEKLKIERNVFVNDEGTDISDLAAMPLDHLQGMREESAAAEQVIFDKLREMAPDWERQASFTKTIDNAIEYVRTPAVAHTSNQWANEDMNSDWKRISNMVYTMSHHVYEDTKYDRETKQSVPVAWYLSWNVYTNSPGQKRPSAVAGQSRKRFTDKASMEKYLAGRIKAYSHLFEEISPPVPPGYVDNFKVRGQLLPGYTIGGEQQKEREADTVQPHVSAEKQTVDYDMAVTAPVATASAPTSPIVLTSDNPRGKLKEITDKLEQGIKDIFASDNYKSYLKTLSKFHNYSFNNCILIAMQKPDATHVAGYRAWKSNFKRHVLKDENGIKILAPTPYKIKKEMERIDPKSGSIVFGSDGKPLTEEVEITVPAFKVVSVFDVSQTDGEPLPEIGVSELAGSVDKYKDFFAALEKTSPVPIEMEDIASGAKGYFEQTEKRIAIQTGMSELQTLKTAIHEIAHARLHDIDKNAPKDANRPDRDTREVEAESAAYTVCQHYGLDTSDYSFGYIAGWSGEKELDTLKASLDIIRTEANAIITDIDKHIAELQKNHEHEVIEPDNFTTGEKIKTPRGRFSVADMTMAQMEAAGYGFYHSSDDGNYHIMGNGTRAFAIANPLQTAEMSTEQNLNMIDGTFNNTPTVSELEAKAKRGEPISIIELAGAIKAEHGAERQNVDAPKRSIREQLRQSKEQLVKDKPAQERTVSHKEMEV
jgi:antirestriction protein ArdC